MPVLKAIGILSAVALLVIFILLVWAGFDNK